ncbi:hypothetical protein [Amycolatopsis anabasis]|uniref:hypothetical protein n=1 Tax=Amycolatopsis anabasis TaxID=1840409 RepID=UPI00131C769A|nr:hypothetical protein [Amycolatopsis anabasis]
MAGQAHLLAGRRRCWGLACATTVLGHAARTCRVQRVALQRETRARIDPLSHHGWAEVGAHRERRGGTA